MDAAAASPNRVDITVTATQAEDTLILSIEDSQAGEFPSQEQRIALRDLPSPEELKALARGDAELEVVNQVRLKVSRAFLGPTNQVTPLGQSLRTALQRTRPVQLVFKRQRQRTILDSLRLELLEFDGPAPLVLNRRISIVHAVPKTSPPRPGQPVQGRLRILLVRSNPRDFGNDVPPAFNLRAAILKIAPHVHIDIVSSESGVDQDVIIGRPTVENLLDILTSSSGYNILIFLGHGALSGGPSNPVGQLLLEESNTYSKPVNAEFLSSVLLQECQIPFALLVACFSAASPETAIRLKEAAGDSVRGSLSVAEALVSGPSDIRIAVGMRHRVNTDDAENMLSSFIAALFDPKTPGCVHPAIYSLRRNVADDITSRPAYAAPVVFVPLGLISEPFFDIRRTGSWDIPGEQSVNNIRQLFWETLRLYEPDKMDAHPIRKALDSQDSKLILDSQREAIAVVMPGRMEAYAGDSAVIDVNLHSPLGIQSLDGTLKFGHSDVKILEVMPQSLAHVHQQGYKILFTLAGASTIEFRIAMHEADKPVFKAGTLFQVAVALPERCPEIVRTSIANLCANPDQHLNWGYNALIVRPKRSAPAATEAGSGRFSA